MLGTSLISLRLAGLISQGKVSQLKLKWRTVTGVWQVSQTARCSCKCGVTQGQICDWARPLKYLPFCGSLYTNFLYHYSNIYGLWFLEVVKKLLSYEEHMRNIGDYRSSQRDTQHRQCLAGENEIVFLALQKEQ